MKIHICSSHFEMIRLRQGGRTNTETSVETKKQDLQLHVKSDGLADTYV